MEIFELIDNPQTTCCNLTERPHWLLTTQKIILWCLLSVLLMQRGDSLDLGKGGLETHLGEQTAFIKR